MVGAVMRVSVWWLPGWSIVAVISECLVRGVLISGALVIQLVVVAGSVSTAAFGWSGKAGFGGCGWLGTLLGPEETDRFAWLLLCAVVVAGLFSPGLVSCHTGRGLRVVSRGFGCLVVGWAGCLVVVCELHSGREHLCGQVI
ncbi:hypothetical protein GCM10027612_70430 [Microbispora bryophytorum subsp. camponoti]